MLITDPHEALAVANRRSRQLCEEAAAERLHRNTGARRALAGSLRRLADRLDPDRFETGPFAPRPA